MLWFQIVLMDSFLSARGDLWLTRRILRAKIPQWPAGNGFRGLLIVDSFLGELGKWTRLRITSTAQEPIPGPMK